jgi:hypothetical protein
MAIPGTPTNYVLQTGNRTNLLTWDITPTATSYQIQRSLDGVTYANYASVPDTSYLDTVVTVGTQYYYQVAAVNVDGTSPYTDPQAIIPAPTAEMSLAQLRLMSKQKADMVNSEFITTPEWNNFINLAMYELYDLLITQDEEYFVATPVQFSTTPGISDYPLPDGFLTFINSNTLQTVTPEPFFKLKGMDLGVSPLGDGWVPMSKFNFIDRNKFAFVPLQGTTYGLYAMQYRMLGNKIQLMPAPAANQQIRIWYIPRLKQLLKDTDLTTLGISGWLAYVIARAAKYALDKEQSPTQHLDAELVYLKQRIEATSANRDTGRPDTISDSSGATNWGWPGGNYGGGYSGGDMW